MIKGQRHGTALAQSPHSSTLTYPDMPIMGQLEVILPFREGLFGEIGKISESSRNFL